MDQEGDAGFGGGGGGQVVNGYQSVGGGGGCDCYGTQCTSCGSTADADSNAVLSDMAPNVQSAVSGAGCDLGGLVLCSSGKGVWGVGCGGKSTACTVTTTVRPVSVRRRVFFLYHIKAHRVCVWRM